MVVQYDNSPNSICFDDATIATFIENMPANSVKKLYCLVQISHKNPRTLTETNNRIRECLYDNYFITRCSLEYRPFTKPLSNNLVAGLEAIAYRNLFYQKQKRFKTVKVCN